MNLFSSDLIRPLHVAENSFLEVLISQFSLKRTTNGTEMKACFDSKTPAIWTRQAKYDVLKQIRNFQSKAKKYQSELDSFLIDQEKNFYNFNDPAFPFRYASGGTLPIVRLGKKEFYCLFYRGIFPIGWNIANGGCDTREELLNPIITIERELREELVILDTQKEKRFVFDSDTGKPLDRPEFEIARKIWKARFGRLNVEDFEELTIPLKWLNGPDSIKIHFEKEPPRNITGCFLNVNAEDYGIEIDRIGKINLSEDVILCDGEIEKNHLVNRPIGLFEVDKFNEMFQSGFEEFKPDCFFFSGKRYERRYLDGILEKYIQSSAPTIGSKKEVSQWVNSKMKYMLCPVTQNIIRRYLSICTEEPKKVHESLDLFISFGGADEQLAAHVSQYFRNKRIKVFFSKESGDVNYSRAIDEALDSAACLVAVSTNPQNLNRPWPEYEWRRFHVDIRCNRKPDGKMVSFIKKFHPSNLPGPLRFYHSVVFNMNNIDEKLRELSKYALS